MLDPARRQLLGWAAAGLVVVLGGAWFVHGSSGSGGSGAAAVGARSGASAASGAASGSGEALAVDRPAGSGAVVVHVAGWVRRPGVYRLRAGARVQEAVRRAGGARHGADLDALNLAAKLTDGRQVLVARRVAVASAPVGGAPSAGGVAGAGQAPAVPVSLNSATADELGTLDGVGPATAAKIIDYREQHGGFGSVDELDQVPGIGPKKLAALRDHVTT